MFTGLAGDLEIEMSDIVTYTEAGKVVFCAKDLVTLTSPKWGTNGSIALAVMLDAQDKPSCYGLFWEWGGDWSVFGDGQELDADALSGWEAEAVKEAIVEAMRICPDCADGMEWFSDWADIAAATIFGKKLTDAIEATKDGQSVGSWSVQTDRDSAMLVWSQPENCGEMYGDEPWSDWGGNEIIESANAGKFDDSGIDDNGDQWVLWRF